MKKKMVLVVVILVVVATILVPVFVNTTTNENSSNNTSMSEVVEESSAIPEPNYYEYSKEVAGTTITLKIPDTWKYEEIEQSDKYEYVLKMYKENEEKYAVLYYYKEEFAVCGTERINEILKLDNGKNATIGYYGEDTEFSDISFYEMNNRIAFLNYGLTDKEAEEFLDIVKTINID